MLNEFEIDTLRQLVHQYSLSDVLRGLQSAVSLDADDYARAGRRATERAHRDAACEVGRAAAAVYPSVG